ncbi:hypothetical protein GCM10010466_56620 [Planomonospora alba]|uniref:Uncharacterized protein n=1 Tax=Planomonospora alba TaxID=161354 RepID=A0ABP6NUL9_9ACTN
MFDHLADGSEVLRALLLTMLSSDQHPVVPIVLSLALLWAALRALRLLIARIRRYISTLRPEQSRIELQWRRLGINFGTPPV